MRVRFYMLGGLEDKIIGGEQSTKLKLECVAQVVYIGIDGQH